jgi:hypothetical protein
MDGSGVLRCLCAGARFLLRVLAMTDGPASDRASLVALRCLSLTGACLSALCFAVALGWIGPL